LIPSKSTGNHSYQTGGEKGKSSEETHPTVLINKWSYPKRGMER